MKKLILFLTLFISIGAFAQNKWYAPSWFYGQMKYKVNPHVGWVLKCVDTTGTLAYDSLGSGDTTSILWIRRGNNVYPLDFKNRKIALGKDSATHTLSIDGDYYIADTPSLIFSGYLPSNWGNSNKTFETFQLSHAYDGTPVFSDFSLQTVGDNDSTNINTKISIADPSTNEYVGHDMGYAPTYFPDDPWYHWIAYQYSDYKVNGLFVAKHKLQFQFGHSDCKFSVRDSALNKPLEIDNKDSIKLAGHLQYKDGNQNLNKILLSDANGNATWQKIDTILQPSITGNGSTTSFTIAHGLGVAPIFASLTAKNANAASGGVPYLTYDATNIVINFTTAPSSGSVQVDLFVKLK